MTLGEGVRHGLMLLDWGKFRREERGMASKRLSTYQIFVLCFLVFKTHKWN